MRQKILLDSSVVLALINRADPDHEAVVETYEEIKASNDSLYMSNFLLSETYTLLGARLTWDIARSWLEEFDLPLVRVTPEDEANAKTLLLSYDDKSYSYVDATSFVLMKRLGGTLAFTLDKDFKHHGYKIKPDPHG